MTGPNVSRRQWFAIVGASAAMCRIPAIALGDCTDFLSVIDEAESAVTANRIGACVHLIRSETYDIVGRKKALGILFEIMRTPGLAKGNGLRCVEQVCERDSVFNLVHGVDPVFKSPQLKMKWHRLANEPVNKNNPDLLQQRVIAQMIGGILAYKEKENTTSAVHTNADL